MCVLQDKVAIVTGGGQGLGKGVALAFAKEKANVVVVDINPITAEAAAGEIRQLGLRALGIACDVGKEDQVKWSVGQAVKTFGPIDILVCAAQSWGDPDQPRLPSPTPAPIEEFPEVWWDNTFQSGLKGTWYFSKAVFPYMRARGGKIITFSSSMGLEGATLTVDFNCCKEATRAFTRTAAREWGKYRINVNSILPAALSPSALSYMKERPDYMEEAAKRIPLGRFGDAEKDVGRVAVFLASPDSDFVTGQTIEVNGGRTMRA